MANEQDSTVAVVHGCFPEGGEVSKTKSHDQPGCACARTLPVNIAYASKIRVK